MGLGSTVCLELEILGAVAPVQLECVLGARQMSMCERSCLMQLGVKRTLCKVSLQIGRAVFSASDHAAFCRLPGAFRPFQVMSCYGKNDSVCL